MEVTSSVVRDRAEVLAELSVLFAEQTGYELDELDPEYQLEADLGIDTVKQAEIFGVIRERYGMGQDENFKLSDFQTLHAVTDYVLSMSAETNTHEVKQPAAVPVKEPVESPVPLQRRK